MKKYPKAVFVIENGKYIELTYKEFCIRFSQMTMSDKLYSILEKLDKEEKEMIDLYF